MSRIKVWTSDGAWSKEVEGLDKIHFMKKSIRSCAPCFDYQGEPVPHPLEGFEIDSEEINDEFRMNVDNIPDPETGEVIELDNFWGYFRRANGGAIISSARTFKLPLPAFMSVKKDDPLCAALYDELLDAAKVPAGAAKDYCLLFKFEDE